LPCCSADSYSILDLLSLFVLIGNNDDDDDDDDDDEAL